MDSIIFLFFGQDLQDYQDYFGRSLTCPPCPSESDGGQAESGQTQSPPANVLFFQSLCY
jgi:hypothetical protein